MQLTNDIERRTDISGDEFAADYFRNVRPAIVTDAIAHWPALGRWTPEFFKREYGDLVVEVDGTSLEIRDLIDQVERSTTEKPAPYLHNQPLAEWPPELLADVSPMPSCTRPNWFESRLFPSRTQMTFIEAYIGGEGGRFPVLHYDGLHTHAFLMQLYGEKEYIVFPPDQTEHMYPREPGSNLSNVDDVLAPDLDRFPLFDRATGVRFQLHPGETLFVPGGWWHTARILSPSITVSVNGVNRANGASFRRDYVRQIARRSRSASYAVSALLHLGASSRLFEII